MASPFLREWSPAKGRAGRLARPPARPFSQRCPRPGRTMGRGPLLTGQSIGFRMGRGEVPVRSPVVGRFFISWTAGRTRFTGTHRRQLENGPVGNRHELVQGRRGPRTCCRFTTPASSDGGGPRPHRPCRKARPGWACVWCPPSSTTWPLTSTYGIPTL
jgi:hypothetical protein